MGHVETWHAMGWGGGCYMMWGHNVPMWQLCQRSERLWVGEGLWMSWIGWQYFYFEPFISFGLFNVFPR
jgi:hypothetical protein